MFCEYSDLGNESDVEQKLIYPLLTSGLGYLPGEIVTKLAIPLVSIGKGNNKRLYRPDYVLFLAGLPVVVIEAKAPGENLEEALWEASQYSFAINRKFPSMKNPCMRVVACNGTKLISSPYDTDEIDLELDFSELNQARGNFTKLAGAVSRSILLLEANELSEVLFDSSFGLSTDKPWAFFDRRVYRGSKKQELERLLKRISATTKELRRAYSQLVGGRWIARVQNDTPITLSVDSECALIPLLGEAGVGKTAFLANVIEKWTAEGAVVFAIKCDVLPPAIVTQEMLSDFLDLPAPVSVCIRKIAGKRRVGVVIDQLDALSELSDLKTGRLNVILDLIQKIQGIPNVTTVFSCRAFDYAHDTRLKAIEAEPKILQPFTKEIVCDVLKQYKLDVTTWPDQRIEPLQNAQYLKLFVDRLVETNESSILNNYQQLLDDLWERKITDTPDANERLSLVSELSEYLSNEEVLWAAAVKFQSQRTVLKQLVSDGIIKMSVDKMRVSFSHQTLFEHSRARNYASGGESLVEYVVQRQDSLFVRPSTWAGLRYLRDAAPTEYQRQLEGLFGANLRIHLKFLLIDFLGQVRTPQLFEIAQLVAQLDEKEFRRRVLFAVRGNQDWFATLFPSHLPVAMSWTGDDAWAVANLLQQSLVFDRDNVLKLIRQCWLPNPSKDLLTLNTLRENSIWDEQIIADVCEVVSRQEVIEWFISSLAKKVCAVSPKLAPRLIAAWFKQRISKIKDKKLENSIELRNVIADTQGWFDLPKIAEAAPGEFLDNNWSWFVGLLDDQSSITSDKLNVYRLDHSIALDFSDDAPVHYHVVESFRTAVETLAKASPTAFGRFVEQNGKKDLDSVQRLIVLGFIASAEMNTDDAVRFITADPRRIWIGARRSFFANTRRLLRALKPHLSDSDVSQVEKAIMSSSYWLKDALVKMDKEDRQADEERNEYYKAEFLSELPEEKLSAEGKKLLQRFNIEEADDQEDRRGGLRRVVSPMSVKEMEAASNDDILRLFNDLVDATEEDPFYSKSWRTVEASRTFAEFAKVAPDRAIELLPLFRPADQQMPVSHALPKLAETGIDRARLLACVVQLYEQGFRSDDFREAGAQAIEAQISPDHPLPESICELLEKWLGEPWKSITHEDPESNLSGSILWGLGGFTTLPHGRYWVVRALLHEFLTRQPAAYDRMLTVLFAELKRNDSTEVWKALYEFLKYVGRSEKNRFQQFVAQLFDSTPGLLTSVEGLRLIATWWEKLPTDWLSKTISQLKTSSWKFGGRAYGEMISFGALAEPVDDWAAKEVEKIIAAIPKTSADQEVRLGLAYTATHLWEDPVSRHRANDVINKLMPNADKETATAIMWLFALVDYLPGDPDTQLLLESLLENASLLEIGDVNYLIDHLEEFLPSLPDLVYGICTAIVERRAGELVSIQYSLTMSAPNLVNIALTLQRISVEFRAKGLELFEKLLVLGLQEAQSAVDELDLRPVNVGSHQRMPRRQRKRRG